MMRQPAGHRRFVARHHIPESSADCLEQLQPKKNRLPHRPALVAAAGLVAAVALGPVALAYCLRAAPLCAALFLVQAFRLERRLVAVLLYGALAITAGLALTFGATSPLNAPFRPHLGNGDAASYALVTGASSGIGWEVSLELWGRGWNLFLVCRNTDKLQQQLRDRIGRLEVARTTDTPLGPLTTLAGPRGDGASGTTGHIALLGVDLSRDEKVNSLLSILEEQGYVPWLDLCVFNAGVAHLSDFRHLPLERLETMIHLNLLAPTKMAHALLPAFIGRTPREENPGQRGRMLFLSSIAGCSPGPLQAVYSATKAYLASLGQAIAHEVERHGVGVTVSAPGAVWTAFATASHAEAALCFQIPFLPSDAPTVAREAVEATLAGEPYVVHGWINKVYAYVFTSCFPTKLVMTVSQLAWTPLSQLGWKS